MKKTIALLMALVMVLCLLPSMTLAALDTGHRIAVRFTVLYVDNDFYLGYNTVLSEKTTFVCQYSEPHSDNAYNNHTIAISDIKAAAERATVNSGYEITGWTKEASANPKVWGFNIKEPTACNKGDTIYLVAKRTQPQTQTITLTYNANGGENAPASETKRVEKGQSATFTVSTQEPTRENYTFKGWSTNKNATTAEFIGGNSITISQNTTLYAVWEENNTPTPPPSAIPSQPDADTLKNLLGNIKVTCVTLNVEHGTKEFDLIDGSYTVGAVEGDATSGYTCKVSIFPDKYVDAYNNLINGHTVTEATAKIVTLKSNNDSAWMVDRGTPVEFNVKCETEQPTPPPSAPPAKPDDHDTLKSLLDKIKVTCVTNVTAHGTKEFDLIDGSYTVGAVEGNPTSGYTCEVSISPDKYVEAYNAELSLVHTTDDTAKIVTLKCNDDSAWVVDRGTPVEFNVKCETPHPTTPDKPIDNDVPDIIGRGAVKVHCKNDDSGSDDQYYGILPDSFSIGDVILKDGVYTCDITVYPELYVAEYVKDFGSHTLSPTGQTGTITLIYYAEEQAWKPMPNQNPIVFYVKCSDEDKTFTVTYLDGFGGTYATYTNLKSGDATPVPANPYRSGYIFLRWEPSVAPTVTDDARYVAQWGYIGPQYPNPTPVQPVQPGILPPQTGDMPLWYAIARFLGLVK